MRVGRELGGRVGLGAAGREGGVGCRRERALRDLGHAVRGGDHGVGRPRVGVVCNRLGGDQECGERFLDPVARGRMA